MVSVRKTYWGGVINSYIIKLVKLYILWTLLYLPLTYYGSCVVENNSLFRAFALFCRNVLFTGENHMSWPLWYLLALIWASFLVKIMLKQKMRIEWILVCGLCLTLIGWGIKYVLEAEHIGGYLEKIVYVYKKTFVGTRNGLFVGLGFVSVGMFLGKWQDYFLKHIAWNYWMTAVSVVAFLYDLPFSKHLLCFCILLFVIRIKLPDRKLFPWCRRMSTLIYFSHMFFVAALVHLFPEVHAGLPQFALASVSTFFFSCIIIRLMEVPEFFFLKKLVG